MISENATLGPQIEPRVFPNKISIFHTTGDWPRDSKKADAISRRVCFDQLGSTALNGPKEVRFELESLSVFYGVSPGGIAPKILNIDNRRGSKESTSMISNQKWSWDPRPAVKRILQGHRKNARMALPRR